MKIEGLPIDWQARIDALDGTIYFLHIPSSHRQAAVPPGFADFSMEMDGQTIQQAVSSSHDDSGTVVVHPLAATSTASVLDHVFGTDSEYFRVVDESHCFQTYTAWASTREEGNGQGEAEGEQEMVTAEGGMRQGRGEGGQSDSEEVEVEEEEP